MSLGPQVVTGITGLLRPRALYFSVPITKRVVFRNYYLGMFTGGRCTGFTGFSLAKTSNDVRFSGLCTEPYRAR